MNENDRRFTYEEVAHAPVQVGRYTVTPIAYAAAIHFPLGGFVWNRPVAVEVQQGDQIERLPIPDVTRLGQIGAIFAGAGMAFLLWLVWRSR